MIHHSHSQSGQDRFVDLILEGMRDGEFLEIGCNHPVELSNTFALEKERGWRGTMIDNDPYCVDLCRNYPRAGICVLADATSFPWDSHFQPRDVNEPHRVIDYLSLDVDAATLATLRGLLDSRYPRFRVLTVETDLYRFGPGPRDAIDALLAQHGYDVLCRNVRASDGCIYESWCVDPKLVNMKVAGKFRSDGLKWTEILERA